MASVSYVSATRVFSKGAAPAVDALDLNVQDGEFMVLVGPSGSGKTTALRMLAGLEPIDGGRVEIGGQDVTWVPPKDRDIAMVFQNYALYPQKTVAENMAFALKMQRVPQGGPGPPRAGSRPAAGPGRPVARSQAQAVVRWPAAAGGHGASHRTGAEGLPDG